MVWSHQNVITEDDDENLSQKEREKLLKQQLLQEPRLFISGLNGLITEYDIHTLLPKVYYIYVLYILNFTLNYNNENEY